MIYFNCIISLGLTRLGGGFDLLVPSAQSITTSGQEDRLLICYIGVLCGECR